MRHALRWWFANDNSPAHGLFNMRMLLRAAAGLPEDGPPSEVVVWRDGGPNHAPTWTELRLDWTTKKWSQLGINHGDVLVV